MSLVDLRSCRKNDPNPFGIPRERINSWPEPMPSLPCHTSLGRSKELWGVVEKQLPTLGSTIRALQVGIGDTFCGETLEILAILERAGREYQLLCMDANLWVLLRHVGAEICKVDGALYHQFGFSLAQVRGLVDNLSGIIDQKIVTPRWVPQLGGPDHEVVDYEFTVKRSVLERIRYVRGHLATSSLPPECRQFELVVCLRSLYHIQNAQEMNRAVRNMASYATGLLVTEDPLGKEIRDQYHLEPIFRCKDGFVFKVS